MDLFAARWRLLGAALLVASPSPARAAAAVDQATAEALFAQGRKLLAAGHYAEACPKLAESQRLDPAIGTLLNLGDCYEKLGRTASAWAEFREAAEAAHRAGDARRENVARDRAAALEAHLPMLTIVVPAASKILGIVVKRDGVIMGSALWGTAAPVDPGPHAIEAGAPGKQRWIGHVSLDAAHPAASITVPALIDLPVDPAAIAADRPRSSAQKIAAGVTAGAGLAAIGLGTVFGVMARGKRDDSAAHCHGNLCDALGVELRDDALTAADASTAAFVIGLASIAGGAVLWLTAPRSPKSTSVALSPGPGLAGLGVRGVFQ